MRKRPSAASNASFTKTPKSDWDYLLDYSLVGWLSIKPRNIFPLNNVFSPLSIFCPRISRIYTNILLCIIMATCSVARICTNSLIVFVRLVRPYRSPFNSLKMFRVDSCDSWAKKNDPWIRNCLQLIQPTYYHTYI